MAKTAEAKVKEFISKFMDENFPDSWKFSPASGMFGNTGVPDRLYLWKGVFIAIEAKAEGNSPTTLQWKHLRHIARQGGVAAVVTGKDLPKMFKIKSTVLQRIENEPKSST